jgi:hypothetical protein
MKIKVQKEVNQGDTHWHSGEGEQKVRRILYATSPSGGLEGRIRKTLERLLKAARKKSTPFPRPS